MGKSSKPKNGKYKGTNCIAGQWVRVTSMIKSDQPVTPYLHEADRKFLFERNDKGTKPTPQS